MYETKYMKRSYYVSSAWFYMIWLIEMQLTPFMQNKNLCPNLTPNWANKILLKIGYQSGKNNESLFWPFKALEVC